MEVDLDDTFGTSPEQQVISKKKVLKVKKGQVKRTSVPPSSVVKIEEAKVEMPKPISVPP